MKGSTAMILFAHGSRDPNWAGPFREIQRRVARAKPDLRVELAFLEFTEPTLPHAAESLLNDGCDSLTVVPLFMAQGAHLRRDLAELLEEIRRQHPRADIQTLPALGESPAVLDAISDWVVEHA